MNFQHIISHFQDSDTLLFKTVLEKLDVHYDIEIYILETTKGTYYLFYTDYFTDMNEIYSWLKEKQLSYNFFHKIKDEFSIWKNTDQGKKITWEDQYSLKDEMNYALYHQGDYYFLIKK